MSNSNGRVDLTIPNSENIFKLYDKIPNKMNSYFDAMNGNLYNTPLSNAYFSKNNMQIIQNSLRKAIYTKTNNLFIIGQQSPEALMTIMRSIFLQESENLPENITSQIELLNKKVLEYAVPQVHSELQGYLTYKDDVSKLAIPMDKPTVDRPYHKQLEYGPRF
jgi:hypothetical protein